MLRPRRLAPLALLLLTPLALAQDPAQLEAAGRAKVAEEWADLGRWCVRRKLGDEARRCLERARAAAPEHPDLARLSEEAADCPESPSERNRAALERRRAATARDVARVYDALAEAAERFDDRAVRARLRGYVVEALAVEPTSERWRRLLGLIGAAVEGEDIDGAVALAGRAQALGPPADVAARLEEAVELAAVDRVVLRRASTHPMRYYLSLPRGWRRGAERPWPVLVGVDGAGSGFEGMAQGYAGLRGDLPYIVVSPCSFSNTNRIEGDMRTHYERFYTAEEIAAAERDRMGWDAAGLLAVLDDVRARYGGAERVFVTGFSGGGFLTYRMIFDHPERVAAAAPACANFIPTTCQSAAEDHDEEARTFPIHLITGADDPHRDFTHGNRSMPGIEPQTDQAEALLRERGYPHVERTLEPGLAHSPAREQVLATFRPYLLGEKARSDPLD